MNNKVYFGTKDRMRWVKAPAVNTPLTKGGWANTGTDLNGGGYAKLSPSVHREYEFSWGASPAQDIYDVLDYRSGAYGLGPLYYLDPFAMRTNAFSEAFSMPSSLCVIGRMGGTYSPPTGSRVEATNLATNPRMNGTAGTVVVWKNWHLNPGAVSGVGFTAWLGGSGNTFTASRDGVAQWTICGGIRYTWTARVGASGTLGPTVPSANGIPGLTERTIVWRFRASEDATYSQSLEGGPNITGTTSSGPAFAGPETTGVMWLTYTPTIEGGVPGQTRTNTSAVGARDGFWVEIGDFDFYEGPYQPDRKPFSGSTPSGIIPVRAESSPVTVPYPEKYVIQSLDGRQKVDFVWRDNGLPRDPYIDNAAFAVPGRRRPPVRFAPGGDGTGALEIRADRANGEALHELLMDGRPVVVRTDGNVRDLKPVDVIMITAAPSILFEGDSGISTQRVWSLSYLLVDDPEPDVVLGAATWADFNAIYAGMTWADFNSEWQGQTWGQFNAYDWAQRL